MSTTSPSKGFVHRGILIIGVLALAAGVIVAWRWAERTRAQNSRPNLASLPTYVGEERCASCHAEEAKRWSQSDHAHAMQKATEATVLGNFNGAQFSKDGVTSTFYKKENKFFVRTDGPEGKLQDYEIAYTFGIYPLQQYVIPFPNGRFQSLVLAWDTRPKDQNGQRWFHLYPDQKISHTDPLHWTGKDQTWNYMCADCHSTNLRANYDLARDAYATTWSEINVSCEQCHGPGSEHVAWAEKHTSDSYKKADATDGLIVNLKPVSNAWGLVKPDDVTKHWQGQSRSRTEFETCAPCHSRRRPIVSHFQPGDHFLDDYIPSLLEEWLYYPDGQILGEDYEYGSFLQSKMYREGVTCSDCHDPHSGKLKQASFNATCGQCHSLAKFDTPSHHHHIAGSAEAQCVNCHMPTRTYMVVDPRRDHSFRVPRPDLSSKYGTPNACNQCHTDKSSKWAAEAVVKWFGAVRDTSSQFVEALDAGRHGQMDAEKLLASLIADSKKPAIARATALSLLPSYLTSGSIPAVHSGLEDSDALVRAAATHALEPFSPQERVALAAPLLADPVRSVRIEAARLLVGTPPQLLQEAQKTALDSAISELVASEMATAERPENHMNLSLLYAQMGRGDDAKTELNTALRLDPKSIPAMVNLADLYRGQGRDADAEQWLEKAIALAPNSADAIHALGLLKVRQKQYPDGLALLGKAAGMQPGNVRYSYVYAVALNSSRQSAKAIAVLEQAHKRRPADRDALSALVAFERDAGNLQSAISYAEQLIQLDPNDPNAKALLTELRSRVR
jgi:tetratricopeptide (TPR) repeat protein